MRRRPGFTLIECVIATFIVMLAVITVVSALPMAYRGASADKQRLTALRVAQDVIAQVQARPFGADPSSLKGTVQPEGETVEGNALDSRYTIDTVAVDIPAGSDHGTVTVTIRWDEGSGVGSSRMSKALTLTGGVTREP